MSHFFAHSNEIATIVINHLVIDNDNKPNISINCLPDIQKYLEENFIEKEDEPDNFEDNMKSSLVE